MSGPVLSPRAMLRFSRETMSLVASAVAAVACAAGALALAQGCSLKNCEATNVWIQPPTAPPPPAAAFATAMDIPPGEGPVDDGVCKKNGTCTTWQSGPIDGVYLDFPGQRTYAFFPLGNDGFTPPYSSITAYVSADADPTHTPGSNFTIGTGNLAEVQGDTEGGFAIHNDTCAQYYLRVVVTRVVPQDGGAAVGPADAAVDGDDADLEAGFEAGDADLDAGVDATRDAADAGSGP